MTVARHIMLSVTTMPTTMGHATAALMGNAWAVLHAAAPLDSMLLAMVTSRSGRVWTAFRWGFCYQKPSHDMLLDAIKDLCWVQAHGSAPLMLVNVASLTWLHAIVCFVNMATLLCRMGSQQTSSSAPMRVFVHRTIATMRATNVYELLLQCWCPELK
jgi:hypothetical protein